MTPFMIPSVAAAPPPTEPHAEKDPRGVSKFQRWTSAAALIAFPVFKPFGTAGEAGAFILELYALMYGVLTSFAVMIDREAVKRSR